MLAVGTAAGQIVVLPLDENAAYVHTHECGDTITALCAIGAHSLVAGRGDGGVVLLSLRDAAEIDAFAIHEAQRHDRVRRVRITTKTCRRAI